ncbi:MAG: nitrous oxide reductase family maturation protein NosD [Balneolaceae bacterium]
MKQIKGNRIAFGFVLVFILCMGQKNLLFAQNKTLTVSNDGEITSLRQAVDIAVPGDTIRLTPGVYAVNKLIINKPLTIRGTEGVIIDLESKGFGLVINGENITLKDFEIRNSGFGFMEDFAAVLIEESQNINVENLKVTDNFFGIYVAKSEDVTLSKNIIESNATRQTTSGNGVHVWYSKNIEIHQNRISGQRDGIYIEFVENSRITGNSVEGNIRYGLHFMYSDGCDYIGNVFKDNISGVAVMYSGNVVMTHNRFEQNWGSNRYGLLLKEIKDSRIQFNVFEKNTVAVYAEASNRILIESNEFIENGTALRMMANGVDNRILANNFVGNAFEVTTNSRQNPNHYRGNYWSQYDGYDLDRDGTGDVPHRPVRLFSILVEKHPESLVLLRSMMAGMLDTIEQVMPVLTPENLVDESPKMNRIQ